MPHQSRRRCHERHRYALRLFSEGVEFGGVTLIPALHLMGAQKFATVWIAHTAFGLPLCIFLFHDFLFHDFRSELPRELMEAARVDGADHARIFRSIVLPLIVPALASFGIFQFLSVWNDLPVVLIFGGRTPRTAPSPYSWQRWLDHAVRTGSC